MLHIQYILIITLYKWINLCFPVGLQYHLLSFFRLLTMVLVLLISIIGFVAANPFPNTLNDQLVPQVQKALSLSTNDRLDTIDDSPDKINDMVENMNEEILSIPKHTIHHLEASGSKTRENKTNERRTQERKHKAVFVDYPLLSHILHYSRMPTYKIDYNDNSELTTKDKLAGASKRYQESDMTPAHSIHVCTRSWIHLATIYILRRYPEAPDIPRSSTNPATSRETCAISTSFSADR